jgi:hypothetical protein
VGSGASADNYAFDNQIPEAGGSSWHAQNGTTYNWAPEGLPGAGDNAFIDGFNVIITTAPVAVAQLNTVGGSLTVGNHLTINNSGSIANLHLGRDLIANGAVSIFGNSDWNVGTISGGGGVTNNGTFTTLQPPPNNVMVVLNSTFTNAGTFHLNNTFRLDNSIFRNNDTFNINTSISGINGSSFVNAGMLATAGGNGNLNVALLNSGGVVAAAGSGAHLQVTAGSEFFGGAIAPSGGGVISLVSTAPHVIAGNVQASGDGDLLLGGTVTINADQWLSGLLTGTRGLFLSGGTVNGAGELNNRAKAHWEGTVISNGVGLINRSGAILTLGTAAQHTVNSRVDNSGTTVHNGRGLLLNLTGTFTNGVSGTYEFRASAGSSASITGLGTYENFGGVAKYGSDSVSINSVFNSFPGSEFEVHQGTVLMGYLGHQRETTFTTDAGATLNWQNNYTFGGNNRFEGQGTVVLSEVLTFNTGTTVFNMQGSGVAHLTDNTNAMVMFLNAPVENHGNFRITGSAGIDAPTSDGKFTNSIGAILEIHNNPRISAPLENLGTINQMANSSIRLDAGGHFTNKRNYNITSGTVTSTGVTPFSFVNDGGTIIKSGANTFTFDVPFNTQGGEINLEEVEGSTVNILNLSRGGVHGGGARYNMGSLTELQLNQTHTASGDVTFDGGRVRIFGSYNAVNGTSTFKGSGSLTIENSSSVLGGSTLGQVVIERFTLWHAGTFSGGSVDPQGNIIGGIVNTSTINIGDGPTRQLSGILQNNSHVGFHGGSLNIPGGMLINNNDIFVGVGAVAVSITGSTGGRIINRGVITSQNALNIQLPFDFQGGTIHNLNEHISFSGGGTSNGSGIYNIGHDLRFAGGTHIFNGDYQAQGAGILMLSSGEIRGDFTANMTGNNSGFVISGGTINGPEGQPVSNVGTALLAAGTITGAGGFVNAGTFFVSATGSGFVTGRISNAGVVVQLGGLSLGAGGQIENQVGARWQHQANITGSGRTIVNKGEFMVTHPSGTINHTFDNQQLLISYPNSNLTLAGNVVQFDAATGILIGGRWHLDGTLTLEGGQPLRRLEGELRISGQGNLTNLSSPVAHDFENRGNLYLGPGAFRFNGDFDNHGNVILDRNTLNAPNFSNSGTLYGKGFINGEVVTNGVVGAGNSPGVLTITGSFTQTSEGTIETEIAGPTVDSEYDRLVVNGAATLAGNLDLALLDGYIATPYTPFTIITATSISGIFDTIAGIDAGGGFSFATIYHPDHIDVIAALPGDLNLDQQVSIADFLGLAGHFGQSDVGWGEGDLNGDGNVSIADFLSLAGSFGRVYEPAMGALSASTSAVPEPSALLLSVLALWLVPRRRRGLTRVVC